MKRLPFFEKGPIQLTNDYKGRFARTELRPPVFRIFCTELGYGGAISTEEDGSTMQEELCDLGDENRNTIIINDAKFTVTNLS